MQSPKALPQISIISLTSNQPTLPQPPADLRVMRVEEFLQARSLSANSKRAYRRELERFLNWTDKAWSDITHRQITQFKADLLEQGIKPTTVNRAIASLKSFFAWLHKTYPQTLAQSPTAGVSLQKVPLPPARDLAEEDVEALYAALNYRRETQRRDTAILAVLAHGLRAGEVCALNMADYDGVRLHIRQAKDDSTGTVPLNRQGRTDLNAYLEERQQQGTIFPESPLFLASGNVHAGERLGYQGLYLMIKDLAAIAGIEDFTPHRLRHTYATGLLLKGMDSLHARTLTRHKSEVTFQRYAKRAKQLAAEQAFYQAIGEDAPEIG
jgi:integrase/recombinase XerD